MASVISEADQARVRAFHDAARSIFGVNGIIVEGDYGYLIGRIEADPTFDQLSRLAEACDTRLITVRGIGTGYCDTCAGIGTVVEVKWK